MTESNMQSREAVRRVRGIQPLFAASAVVAAVLFVSFLPNRSKRALHTEGQLHSSLHLVAFVAVGFVLSRLGRSTGARIAAFLCAALFGLAIEVGEHLVYRGAMEWKDVTVDAVGVVVGSLLALDSGT